MGVLQQICGIVLNVVMFTVVMTKFQHPAHDIVFAEKAVITNRHGVPHLLIRIGNQRCNLVYHPEAIISLLVPHKTPEGETFVQSHRLRVNLPGVISGTFTFAHAIDEGSPLHGINQSNHRAGQVGTDKGFLPPFCGDAKMRRKIIFTARRPRGYTGPSSP